MGASDINAFAGLSGPYRTDTDGDGDIEPLVDVQQAERHGEDGQADPHAAQPLLEPVEDERTLQFLPDAAREHRHDEEDGGFERRAHESLERIGLLRVEERRDRAERQHDERHRVDAEPCRSRDEGGTRHRGLSGRGEREQADGYRGKAYRVENGTGAAMPGVGLHASQVSDAKRRTRVAVTA